MVAAHGTIWRFLEALRDDHHDNEILITQLLSGHVKIRHPTRKIYKTNNDFIEIMVANYDQYKSQGKIDTYLKNISYRLKKHPVQGMDVEEEEEEDDPTE